MANQPISVETANSMISAYQKYMVDHGVNMEEQTKCVCFDMAALNDWLAEVTPYSDEIRMFNGLYDSGTQVNRTTVIFWPYKDGQPAKIQQAISGDNFIEPFNDGRLDP
jgi:hypothetical protein